MEILVDIAFFLGSRPAEWFRAALYDWQTLITGVLAVVAAIFSIRQVRQQIDQTAQLEVERRARSFSAARARMPAALDKLSGYCEEIGNLMITIWPNAGIRRPLYFSSEITIPKAPESVINDLASLIETTDNEAFAAFLATLISKIQLIDARMRDSRLLEKISSSKTTVYDRVLDVAELNSFVDTAFAFARHEVDVPPGDNEPYRISLALSRYGFDMGGHRDLHARCAKKFMPDHALNTALNPPS
ncbi:MULTISPECIES: hypothetical protein [Sphingobium]|uniref:hypothetical protein n=1 Tax=Sphingobium TaxID=165695 RepID=UPI0015EC03D9|nr:MULTISPECIES: hypothetical protein [Sphingobium]MCW2361602.1 hypothetical protein [Sphingobium sp. B10D3B]MCW2401719.1 hypothetical protein [Sphingobium sp. B10D7B]MCW2408698.1 hypothetical protein [Sphingobium xanthum]